ncbi:DUF2177 family protein [Desulfoprunum benzoelyticum]|uniref:Putative membrane protein n=1 Tax=Desulfoprunum benzoelyticum TaxID=1506996 RepID=A0A840V6L7_9BACT|nr:DUF2177 family protein [Desulfoprunum benzoelyticum]MBB5348671.1 putative membrane protein [Desulfoprunum benzoelyticum]MBM9530050.1 DUF2177 family protein [Desulfoprunum benzoelyticum]
MNTAFWLKLYLLTVPVFFLIDMIWLGLVARNFYREQLHSLLSPQVNWTAALLFYFIYIAGILFFAVRPGLEAGSLGRACLSGALFGFFTYATYDLTNLATLRDWPVLVSVVDIGWGTLLCTLVSGAAYLIGARLG